MNHVVQYDLGKFVDEISRVRSLYEDMSDDMNNKAQKGRFKKMVVVAGVVQNAVESGEKLPLPLERIMKECEAILKEHEAAETTIGRGSMISYLSTIEIEMGKRYAFWTR